MFKIERKKGNRRIGILKTKNGENKTPFFMPDATRGFVRGIGSDDLEKITIGPMVVNTYHLYLQPGMEIIKKSCGVNSFMNFSKPLLSDSGGYQVFSLIHKNPKMGKVTDEEVIFRSPLDGSTHRISPEKSIEMQFDLGVDMMVCLDDPPPNDYSKEEIGKAVDRTLSWAERCMIEYKRQIAIRKIEDKDRPLIFCVIQGGGYPDLRKKCAEGLKQIGFSAKGGPALGWDGYGFGARHIDENGDFLEEIVKTTASLIPENSLRFALGVGTPEDIIKCVSYGWDMFDCVIPTREGRHGRLFLRKRGIDLKPESGFYETINISNKKFEEDFSPIDPDCSCELCGNYSRAYLRHMFFLKDPLAQRLASIHNLKFYLELMEDIRNE